MNDQETYALLMIFRAVWPDMPVTPHTEKAWRWAFERVTFAQAEQAAKTWIRTGKFAPKPAELLEIIARERTAPNLVPEAAWAEVLREAMRVGYNRLPDFRNGQFQPAPEPTFSSPLIAQAVESVGWKLICTSERPEEVREQFVWALKAITGNAVRGAQVGERDRVTATVPAMVASTDQSLSDGAS